VIGFIWHCLATVWLGGFAFAVGIVGMAAGDWLVNTAAGLLIGMFLAYLALWNMGGF
jgi:hypothetical protein